MAKVTLEWNPVPDANGYKVHYGTETKVYPNVDDVGDQTTHTITLDPGAYYFAVTAYNKYGESGYSTEVACSILASPVIVTIGFSPN